ncbi:MAG: endo-1,4-beta-xylanase, partial [Kiritimatiellae bacterium]|nr:endo-1,4-beta-xylanase [Kiritimatiellia bacterium]
MPDVKAAADVMSPAYYERWNADEQARIDEDIERYRKADVVVATGAPAGAEVQVEQVSHAFRFGAHLFNFDQLGSHERNERHKALWSGTFADGALFNSATIAFYWRPFEPVEGKMRFEAAPEDSEEWWNACPDPKAQRFWRRPPSEPCVRFCEEKGVWKHGHPIVWSNPQWHYPDWLMAKLPREILAEMLTDDRSGVSVFVQPMEEVLKRFPAEFPEAVAAAHRRRIAALAARYGGRMDSWDVCNESAGDLAMGNLVPGSALARSFRHTWMPGDYCHWAFRECMKAFPAKSVLSINDYQLDPVYAGQTRDQLALGDKIDLQGMQMHLFNPADVDRIAAGSELRSPAQVRAQIAAAHARPGLPIHLSEITVSSPGGDERGERVQAEVTRNLYRLWFSLPDMAAITWWNAVDDCGAPREPSVSGLFHRDMTPKKAYFALDDLVNREWRTRATVVAGPGGEVAFRGFKGRYRLTWRDASGAARSAEAVAG